MLIAMYVVWPILAIVAVIVEINTNAQVGWALALASLVGLTAHGITSGDPTWIEFLVAGLTWIVSWIILFFIFRKYRHHFHDSEDGYLQFIGQKFPAYKGNETGYGEIKINDKFFRFKAEEKVLKNEQVIVEKIRGVTFYVKKRSE